MAGVGIKETSLVCWAGFGSQQFMVFRTQSLKDKIQGTDGTGNRYFEINVGENPPT
jgi:hypothetical protein